MKLTVRRAARTAGTSYPRHPETVGRGKPAMRLTIFALAVACGALVVPGALADQPDRQRLPIGIFNDFPAGAACPTDLAPEGVHLQLIGGNEAVTFFDNGKFLATGLHILQVTNVASPDRSVILDIHGSFASDPQADGSSEGRGSGTTGFVFLPGDAGPGDTSTGRIYLFTGNVRLVEDSSGAVVSFESQGQTEDVCAMIAS
jgi:hypothetical protein